MKATRREWIGLAVIALPCMLATMDLTVLNLAVPHLSADLKPTTSQLLWIMDIYGFMIAGALITMGTLGDRIGRRKVLLFGALAFGVASVLAAFSRTPETLIATRGLLGLAGATLAPSTLSLIRNMFLDERERTTAIGIWVTCFSVGAAIGPLMGGILLEHFWWGSVFLLNVPVMVLLLILGPLLLPEFKDPNAGRLDLRSAGMSLVAVLLVIYGLKVMAEHGVSAVPLASVAAGVVVGVLFVRRQKRLSDPLIDLALFRSPAFSAALFLNLLGCFAAFGAFFFVAQFLQFVLGLSPLQAGLWSLPSSAAFVLGSMGTLLAVKRFAPGVVLAAGLLLSACGYGMLLLVDAATGLHMIVAATFIYSLGVAPIFTLSADLIVSGAPAERAGAAASLSETSTEFGGALGMAVLGSVGMAVYRGQMAPFIPADLAAEAEKAVRGSLGGAVGVAETLMPDLAAALLLPARESFTHALGVVGGINAIISLFLAVVAITLFRRATKPGV